MTIIGLLTSTVVIQKDGHRSAKTVNDAVGYQDPQSCQRFILMINQALHIDGLVNHLLCPIQCCLSGVQINEFFKFFAENQNETTHAIEFDVKMEDFRYRARLVAGGHIIEALATIMYASIMSRETVRIVLMIATLNDVEVKYGNILNAYVEEPVTEMVWTTLGPEFGKDARKPAVIFRALYSLKSAGAAFRSHLTRCMEP